jgi:hypothetical protein
MTTKAIMLAIAITTPLAATGAANHDFRVEPSFFGLHLNQEYSEMLASLPSLLCKEAGQNKECTTRIASSFAGPLDVTVRSKGGKTSEIIVRSPNEAGCRMISAKVTEVVGKPAAKKTINLGSLRTDVLIWSDSKDVKQSNWAVMSLCSPNGPGRAVLFASEDLASMLP